MVVLNIETSACTPQTIVIGRRGTYDTTQIVFDLTYLVESYGSGVAVIAVKRSQDESAYPAIATQDGNTLTWVVSEVDTYYVGAGECQLMWYVGGGLAKTIIYPMVVMKDILPTAEEPPDAYQTWVDDLIAKGEETLHNAQAAARSASEAEQAKDDAVDAKEASEEAARKAEAASVHAPVIVNGYWYAWDTEAEEYQNTGVKAEGRDGVDGYSPSITVDDISGGHRVTITDKDGTQTVDVMNGTDGDDGYSPVVTITDITGGHRVTITDKTHPSGQSFNVTNGTNGTDGNDGYSPAVTVTTITGGHRVTITDKTHPQGQAFDVMDGQDGASDAGEVTYDNTATYNDGTVGKALNALVDVVNDPVHGLAEKAPLIVNTASGDIASFSDGADNMPVKSLVANIEPVQDLHGYDYPWPGGGGANRWDEQWESGWYDQTTGEPIASTSRIRNKNKLVVTPGTTYYFVKPAGVVVYLYYYDANENYITWADVFATAGTGGTFTTHADAHFMNFMAANSVYHNDIAINYPSSVTTYSPYANECSISGHTGLTVARTGKNLFDKSKAKLYNNTARFIKYGVDAYSDEYPNGDCKLGAGTYTLSITGENTENAQSITVRKTSIGANIGVGYNTKTLTFAISETGSYVIAINFADTVVWANYNIQLELGSTASTYAPYTGTTIPITWESEAWTVYGGYIDVVSGKIVANKAIAIYTGDSSENWQYRETTSGHWRFLNANGKMVGATPISTDGAVMNAISSQYKFISRSATYYGGDGIGIAAVNTTALYLYDEQFTTVAELTTYLATHNLQVVYPLSTPIEYTLTANELNTLYGQNNVWTDVGEVSVDYPADTKLYIDNKIATAVANALNA